MLSDRVKEIVLESTNSSDVIKLEEIQKLWSGYGKIIRLKLENSEEPTVILKHIVLPKSNNHPRGWDTNNSHQRKLNSYQVEINWYNQWSKRCKEGCRVAKSFASISHEGGFVIVLEDLDSSGYPIRKSHLSLNEVKVCVGWLANFHATFINNNPDELWPKGTYWHLATRPDELQEMNSGPLKDAAYQIDSILNNCKYKTIAHGDAKVANFCFSKDLNSVAAVDFQYVGGGCGMKDLIYLLGSCLTGEECELWEEEILLYYFSVLKEEIQNNEIDFRELEEEWRKMYPVAWTDFSRFLMGWMPTHQKINGYTKRIEEQVLKQIKDGYYKD